MKLDDRHRNRTDLEIETASLGPLATNCYVVSDGTRTIVIDPAEDAAELHALIDGRAVHLVINTHGHFDHVGGNWAIDPSGTRICIHRDDVPWVDQAYPGHPSFVRFLAEGDVPIPSLRVLHLPGHSRGSIALVGGGAIFCGDVLFAGSIGRTDLPGGSWDRLRQSLRRLISLPGDYVVYPGHGPQTTLSIERKTNPFLDALEP
ncbi:MBL fold metallo-hydrolase [Candidatus Bipolaricaulota bacterium]|nr:MBL fold metallo-hydrolase [Candidatus Bipolaricaulota bacterium]